MLNKICPLIDKQCLKNECVMFVNADCKVLNGLIALDNGLTDISMAIEEKRVSR
ncbi:hypothetical protein SPFL3102_02664 [Sporomusaceae bacterium FL31]|nr:hypothetical protein SPFL3101_02639 [Sporomusaceae bacterium FL31]GCE34837.1 hypothetical protein SPFL3102_02664 [Sporomusaceae bacterium]